MKSISKDTFKILSIDGGGIKGFYSSIILQKFEKKYGPIADYFDLITGTSTGSIIGGALARGISSDKVIEFYEKHGPLILPSNYSIIRALRLIKQIVFKSKYSNKQLRKSLEWLLGDGLMDDAQTRMAISAVDLNTFRGFVFRTSHTGAENPNGKLKMVDVILASSAAPSYLPIVSIKGVSDNLVDGALWANNPTMMAIKEALEYCVGPKKKFKKMAILSVGNIDYNDGWSAIKPRQTSMLLWNKTLLSLSLNVQTKALEELMQFFANEKRLETEHYVRIANTGATSEFKRQIELDRTDKLPMMEISKLAETDAKYWLGRDEINYFFEKKVKKLVFPILK
ncbi:MAG: CBASS cGAMP-activated phospholipase [Leptospirales bacterium]